VTGERPPVRHVLLDADGVMQDLPGGWRAALDPFLGARSEEFVAALADDEQACLLGEPFLPVLGALLERFGVTAPAAEVHAAVWERIEVAPDSVAVVRELRADGLGVHLATNQNPERAAYMRRSLGYGELFDGTFYSCEVGAAKPEPAYFAAALATLGAAPDEVLFVDDSARNVEGARSAGLRAELWHLDRGHDVLRGLLAAHRPVQPG
jgi:putative hydrolase of the HAD superfamily